MNQQEHATKSKNVKYLELIAQIKAVRERPELSMEEIAGAIYRNLAPKESEELIKIMQAYEKNNQSS